MSHSVLLVDDSAGPRRTLARLFRSEGCDVEEAANGNEGWGEFCSREPDVVLTDLFMPKCDGHEFLRRIRTRSDIPVVLFSSAGTTRDAVNALKSGADEFIHASECSPPELVQRVVRLVSDRRPEDDLLRLDRRLAGQSVLAERLRSRVAAAAPLRAPVLIVGEPGSGRDTVAQALHELGASAGGALVKLDARRFVPEDMPAKAGAIYLDGVEQLSEGAQSHWARRLAALDGRDFRGAPRVLASCTPDFVIAPPEPFHAELRALLQRIPIEIPALAERSEDIAPAAERMMERISARMGRPAGLSAAALAELGSRSWPGNFRELHACLQRAVAFSRERTITAPMLGQLRSESSESLEAIRLQHDRRERDALVDALRRTGGNVTRTAELLGRSRGAVYRLISRHGIALGRTR